MSEFKIQCWYLGEIKKDYCFLMKLGEHKTAAFDIKNFHSLAPDNSNNMVLKSKEYFENTVQKIGFWGSENYFYEQGKKDKNPNDQPKTTINFNLTIKITE